MKILFIISGALFLLTGCFTDYEEEYMEEQDGIYYGIEYTVDEELDARLVIDNQSDYDVFVGTGTRDLGGISLYRGAELLISEPELINDNLETIRVNAGERETGSSLNFEIEPGVTYTITGNPLHSLSLIDGDAKRPGANY